MSCNMVRCVLPSFSRLFTFLYCSASLSYLSSFPTRRSSDLTDEADAVFREFLEPTVGIGVMRVAAVDDDVTRFQQGDQAVDHRIHRRSGLDHKHHAPGALHLREKLFVRVG